MKIIIIGGVAGGATTAAVSDVRTKQRKSSCWKKESTYLMPTADCPII